MTNDTRPDDMPKTAKGSAVQTWEQAVEDFREDPNTSDRVGETLAEADLHDRRDRSEIADLIYHGEVPKRHFGALSDALHDVTETFDYE